MVLFGSDYDLDEDLFASCFFESCAFLACIVLPSRAHTPTIYRSSTEALKVKKGCWLAFVWIYMWNIYNNLKYLKSIKSSCPRSCALRPYPDVYVPHGTVTCTCGLVSILS